MPDLGPSSIRHTPTNRPPNTGERLARDWERLRRRTSAVRVANGWAICDRPVADLDEVLTAIGFESAGSADHERRLRQLVLLAAGDDLAARVVVQRILPGLLAVVRRRRRIVGDDAFDELLGAAWVAVRTFNPTRRPSCLAAALIADADELAFRRPARRRANDELPTTEFAHLADDRHPHPVDELDELFGEAIRCGIPRTDIELLCQLLVSPTANALAEHLRVTPRTVRNRRDRITNRLREVALAA